MNPVDREGRTINVHMERAEADVALAAEGLSFDDLVTGEIPVHGRRVKATPDLPPQLPVETAVAFGTVPRLVPRRHARAQRLSTTVRHVLVGSAAAVACDAALIMGLLAGLEALGGAR